MACVFKISYHLLKCMSAFREIVNRFPGFMEYEKDAELVWESDSDSDCLSFAVSAPSCNYALLKWRSQCMQSVQCKKGWHCIHCVKGMQPVPCIHYVYIVYIVQVIYIVHNSCNSCIVCLVQIAYIDSLYILSALHTMYKKYTGYAIYTLHTL